MIQPMMAKKMWLAWSITEYSVFERWLNLAIANPKSTAKNST